MVGSTFFSFFPLLICETYFHIFQLFPSRKATHRQTNSLRTVWILVFPSFMNVFILYFASLLEVRLPFSLPFSKRGEWPSGLYSLRQVIEVKLGRVR